MGKITVFFVIILFLQWRPAGFSRLVPVVSTIDSPLIVLYVFERPIKKSLRFFHLRACFALACIECLV